MLDIFLGLFTFWRRRRRSVTTEGLVFRLHTRVSVALLLLFCIVIVLYLFLTKPVICRAEGVQRDVVDAFCWTHSTFTALNKKPPESIAHDVDRTKEETVRIHRYYKWVPLCFFFQAVFFYIPNWLWSVWEGGMVQRMKDSLCSSYTCDEEKLKRRENTLVCLCSSRNSHKILTIKYSICEVLTLVNLIAQGCVMHRFLGGFFWNYGSRIFNFQDSGTKVHPMTEAFPDITKCAYYQYGASGVIQKYDVVCVLPLNPLNQKIYLFLWVWFMFLIAATCAVLLFRIAVCKSVRLRIYMLRLRCPDIRPGVLDNVVRRIRNGDWFLLYLLNKNLEPEVFGELMEELAQRMSDTEAGKIEFRMME